MNLAGLLFGGVGGEGGGGRSIRISTISTSLNFAAPGIIACDEYFLLL